MSGGKGGEETQTQEIDPQFKQRILSAFDRGDQLSKTAPLNYTGLTMAAPSDATKSYYNQTNDMANLLGLGMASGKPTDGLPEHEQRMGGINGYSSHRGVMEEVRRQHERYPERVAALNSLMPGLMDPSANHRDNEWYRGSQQSLPRAGGGMGYQDIADMYKRYRR